MFNWEKSHVAYRKKTIYLVEVDFAWSFLAISHLPYKSDKQAHQTFQWWMGNFQVACMKKLLSQGNMLREICEIHPAPVLPTIQIFKKTF